MKYFWTQKCMLILIGFFTFSHSVFAADPAVDLINYYAKELGNTPRSNTYISPTGTRVNSVDIPGFPQYRAWTMTDNTGKKYNFVEYRSGDKTIAEFTDQSGNKTSATCEKGVCTGDAPTSLIQDLGASASNRIIVTEPVPGGDCYCIAEGQGNGKMCTGRVETRKYECTVKTEMTGFATVFSEVTKWATMIAILLGVLATAALGIAWSVAGDDNPEYKKKLKDWVINVIIGLIIVFFFTAILRFLAPWIYV